MKTTLNLKPLWRALLGLAMIALLGTATAAERKIRVTTTTSMVTDLVKQVGGDRVEVAGLMGAGVDRTSTRPPPPMSPSFSRPRSSSTTASCWRGR